jgi:hypothetical protein
MSDDLIIKTIVEGAAQASQEIDRVTRSTEKLGTSAETTSKSTKTLEASTASAADATKNVGTAADQAGSKVGQFGSALGLAGSAAGKLSPALGGVISTVGQATGAVQSMTQMGLGPWGIALGLAATAVSIIIPLVKEYSGTLDEATQKTLNDSNALDAHSVKLRKDTQEFDDNIRRRRQARADESQQVTVALGGGDVDQQEQNVIVRQANLAAARRTASQAQMMVDMRFGVPIGRGGAMQYEATAARERNERALSNALRDQEIATRQLAVANTFLAEARSRADRAAQQAPAPGGRPPATSPPSGGGGRGVDDRAAAIASEQDAANQRFISQNKWLEDQYNIRFQAFEAYTASTTSTAQNQALTLEQIQEMYEYESLTSQNIFLAELTVDEKIGYIAAQEAASEHFRTLLDLERSFYTQRQDYQISVQEADFMLQQDKADLDQFLAEQSYATAEASRLDNDEARAKRAKEAKAEDDKLAKQILDAEKEHASKSRAIREAGFGALSTGIDIMNDAMTKSAANSKKTEQEKLDAIAQAMTITAALKALMETAESIASFATYDYPGGIAHAAAAASFTAAAIQSGIYGGGKAAGGSPATSAPGGGPSGSSAKEDKSAQTTIVNIGSSGLVYAADRAQLYRDIDRGISESRGRLRRSS